MVRNCFNVDTKILHSNYRRNLCLQYPATSSIVILYKWAINILLLQLESLISRSSISKTCHFFILSLILELETIVTEKYERYLMKLMLKD